MARYIHPKQLEAATKSSILYLKVAAKDMAMFRFLLEAYDGLAMFTVIEPKTTLVKVLYSPHEEARLHLTLESIQELIPAEIMENPFFVSVK